MRKGYLSSYFTGVVAKRLSAVECRPESSNQHEFNGVRELITLFGKERITDMPVRFVRLAEEDQIFSEDSFVTWYDARENHPARSEYRLYFRTNPVMEKADAGDLLIIARRPSGELMIIVVARSSIEENQLVWLFGLPEQLKLSGKSGRAATEGTSFLLQDIETDADRPVGFASRFILEQLGVEIEEPDEDALDALIAPFKEGFPTTAVFSRYVRETLSGIDPRADPDAALLAWMNREEVLFHRLERRYVAPQLEKGFHNDDGVDINGFIKYSLSVHNRRKSRAGQAFELHVAEILGVFDLEFERQAVTEHNSKPDFLFPGSSEYHDTDFPASRLALLGAKTSCKDRWRQVLSEAERIPDKHLLTLQLGISENQTDEMQANRLQLVLPTGLHATYTDEQRKWLMSVGDFIGLVKDKQRFKRGS